MIRALAVAAGFVVAPIGAAAHQLVVFASVNCEAVTVEAKFSSGRVTQKGEEIDISTAKGAIRLSLRPEDRA